MPRRLAWLTDIHLNFVPEARRDRLVDEIRAGEAEAVLLGGDIDEAPGVTGHLERLAQELERPIWFVLGNHDYYRGDIAPVRERARALTRSSKHLCWLGATGAVEIAPDIALIGHGGWGDARLGNCETSPITERMTDHYLIGALSELPHDILLDKLHDLGTEAAAHLDRTLTEALEHHSRVIVLTHVPPFTEAARHEDGISNADWLPHFACAATGDVLKRTFEQHPEQRAVVLCGHTHSAGDVTILPNLRVLTGAAEYGEPTVQRFLDVDELFDAPPS